MHLDHLQILQRLWIARIDGQRVAIFLFGRAEIVRPFEQLPSIDVGLLEIRIDTSCSPIVRPGRTWFRKR